MKLHPLRLEIQRCKLCEPFLPMGCRPVFSASERSKIVLVGQAPGRRVHETGIPWNDPSGDNLRSWLGVDKSTFYNTDNFALIPMGFCYPGTGKSGDLPPRKECAPQWHARLLDLMPEVRLFLLVGNYAQNYYLASTKGRNLTETVRCYESYLPNFFPLPHPSPRNRLWQKKNAWFEHDLLPVLSAYVQDLLFTENREL